VNEYSAMILEMILNSNGPVTAGMIRETISMSQDALYGNLDRMVKRRELEKKYFMQEGLNPLDYKMGPEGKGGGLPKTYYVLTKRGLSKYEYYKSKGVYEREDNTREMWQKRKGVFD